MHLILLVAALPLLLCLLPFWDRITVPPIVRMESLKWYWVALGVAVVGGVAILLLQGSNTAAS